MFHSDYEQNTVQLCSFSCGTHALNHSSIGLKHDSHPGNFMIRPVQIVEKRWSRRCSSANGAPRFLETAHKNSSVVFTGSHLPNPYVYAMCAFKPHILASSLDLETYWLFDYWMGTSALYPLTIYGDIWIYIYIYMYILYIYIHSIHVYISVYIYTIHMYIQVCIYTHTCTYSYIYNIYIHIYITIVHTD